ncbi:ABC transporter permease [Paenibacillus chitinolyticus]|uniref:ABC transporter permease n=1 Tax=Paenibacillus chitinolyticus TaxID=79263 RepID=UPI00386F48F4
MSTSKPVRKRTFRKKLKRYRMLFLLMVPGIAYLLLNNYLPMLGIIIAFKDINYAKGILASEWVGLKNFEYLFTTSDAFIITRNTLLYNAAFIAVNTFLAVALAILLHEVRHKLLKKFFQSAMLLPYFLSAVIVAYLVYSMLSQEYGFINQFILAPLGLEPVAWYMEPKYWPYILTLVSIWKGVGYLSIVYIAAIIGIDHEYYEASTIDGATKWQQIKHITLPLILPVITIMTLLQIGRIFYADFGLFYQIPMDSGPLLPVTNVIDTYVYRGLMQLGDIGMSSAAGLYQSVVGFVLVLISNLAVRKLDRDNALF